MWARGLVDPAVARVEVRTGSGVVTAGRFAAWWPGNDGDVDLVRAYAADGSLLATADQTR